MLCCTVLRHAVLNCAVLACVVDQAIPGTPTLSELIWILSSSCLRARFAQSWLQSKRAGRSTNSNSRSDSVQKWDESVRGRIRTEAKRTETTTRSQLDTSSNNAKTNVSRETSSTHPAEGAFRCRRGPRSRHHQQTLQNERFAQDIRNAYSC